MSVFTKKTAFSIAEAMITLLIVSLALAAAAPILSRNMSKSAVTTTIPSGVIVFTQKSCSSLDGGWRNVPEAWNGHYPRISGNYSICDKDGANCETQTSNTAAGSTYDDASRNITGGVDLKGYISFESHYGAFYDISEVSNPINPLWKNDGRRINASAYFGSTTRPSGIDFDASKVVPTAQENRPKTVVLNMCEKI